MLTVASNLRYLILHGLGLDARRQFSSLVKQTFFRCNETMEFKLDTPIQIVADWYEEFGGISEAEMLRSLHSFLEMAGKI